jgi:hypothetical protein
MTKWALLRARHTHERDCNYDACLGVNIMPDLADGAARAM